MPTGYFLSEKHVFSSIKPKHDFGFFLDLPYVAIITRGLYTFYPLFEVHLCTVTCGLVNGYHSKAVSNQERVIVAHVQYIF